MHTSRLKIIGNIFPIVTLSVLTACGGGGSGSSSSLTDSSGTFVNSPTKGIKYAASPSGLSGTTDADGKFRYRAGDTVTFSLDLGAQTIALGSTTNPSETTSVLSLVVPNGGDPVAVAQILETLDKSSVDGKMDVSGITLNAGPTLTAISSAIRSSSVSSSSITNIATAVQAALPTGTVLKYGTVGVSQNDALANLSKNPANQSLVETKIKNLSNDGSTLIDIQDKSTFTSWIIKKNGQMTYQSLFGRNTSIGLNFDYSAPAGFNTDWVSRGTYTLSSGNKSGTWLSANPSSPDSGTFEMKSADPTSFSIVYANSTSGETGAISGTFLLPVALNDVKGKSYTLYGVCNGSNSTITINNSGVSSDSCNGTVNGATWTAGPYSNTLKYTEQNGTRHYIGITRLNKNGGVGNLPSGATGTFMDITYDNYNKQPNPIAFKVN